MARVSWGVRPIVLVLPRAQKIHGGHQSVYRIPRALVIQPTFKPWVILDFRGKGHGEQFGVVVGDLYVGVCRPPDSVRAAFRMGVHLYWRVARLRAGFFYYVAGVEIFQRCSVTTIMRNTSIYQPYIPTHRSKILSVMGIPAATGDAELYAVQNDPA